MTSYPHVSLEAVLEGTPLPEALATALGSHWTVPKPKGRPLRAPPATGDPTGAKEEAGEPLLRVISSLVSRGVAGSESICLLGVRENAKTVLVHSLFTVSPDVYSDKLELWGFVGGLPESGNPSLIHLTGMHFSPNFSFHGVAQNEFESHVGGLSLQVGGPNAHAQQVAVESDEDSRKILSRGLCFLPSEMVAAVLELGVGATIAEVASNLVPHLIRRVPVSSAFVTTLEWLQASMTEVKWEGMSSGGYLDGPIRTRREYGEEDVDSRSEAGKVAMARLRLRFPGLYCPRTAAPKADPDVTTESLEAAAAVTATAAVDDAASAAVSWSPGDAPPLILGVRTPLPPVLRVRGGASAASVTAEVFVDADEAPPGGDLPGGGGDGGPGSPGGGGGGGPGAPGGGGGGGGPGGPAFDIESIIRATVGASVAAAMAGAADITRAAVEARTATEETGAAMSEVMRSHLRHICGVATDAEVPAIWAEVAGARSVATKLALLTQHLQTDLPQCRLKWHGHAEEMLHVSLPLLDFVTKGRFSNIGPDPACTAGGLSLWTSPQGVAMERGAAMAATEADAIARDSRLATADHIARSSKVVLTALTDGRRARLESGTMGYFLWRLFGASCPFVAELLPLLDWADTNQVAFDGRVRNSHDATAFGADLSRVLGEYFNSCVRASTTAGLDAPGSRTPVTLAPLMTELSWGPYHGVERLPTALRLVLGQRDERRRAAGLATPGDREARLRREEAARAAVRPAARAPVRRGDEGGGGGGDDGGGGGGGGGPAPSRDRPGAEGAVVVNTAARPQLAIRPGENTRDLLRTFALPTLGGATWCKRWHHGGRCFENCPRRGSHRAPSAAVCTVVADALAQERNPQEGDDG